MKEVKQKKPVNWAGAWSPVLIVGIAVLFTSLLMLAVGSNPLNAYWVMLKGSLGSTRALINTVNKAVPICFAAFAVAIANKAGIFNIGVEGQLAFGAFGAALAGAYITGLPAWLHIPLALLCGMAFGMLYALLPTLLFVRRGVNLLVICIMMNNIVKLLITYFVNGPFAGDNAMVSSTKAIQDSAELPYLVRKPSRLSIGVLIMLAVAVILWWYMNKTTSGYEMRMCGLNRQAAAYSGIPVKRYMGLSLLAGGALAGLAGGVEVLGNYHCLYDNFSPGYGFDGIPIAILAGGNPVGIIVGSLLFGALRTGSIDMQTKAGVSSDIVTVIQGALITLIACDYIFRFLVKKLGKGAGRKKARAEKEATV